jgi:hypothetical protein
VFAAVSLRGFWGFAARLRLRLEVLRHQAADPFRLGLRASRRSAATDQVLTPLRYGLTCCSSPESRQQQAQPAVVLLAGQPAAARERRQAVQGCPEQLGQQAQFVITRMGADRLG